MEKTYSNDNKSFEDFKILDKPVEFCQFFKDQNLDIVQVYSKINTGDIIFCGIFEWSNNQAFSLDGDNFNERMLIYGYCFDDDKEVKSCYILTDNNWLKKEGFPKFRFNHYCILDFLRKIRMFFS